MKNIKDETLMAFVDSELGMEESKEVELALTDNPQARSKVEEFRKTRNAINSFAEIMDEPVPDHLIETIRRHEHMANVARLPEQPRRNNWFLLAASLIAGISVGAISTKYFISQPHDKVATTEISTNITSLAASLEAARQKAAVAEAKLADISKALDIALEDKEKAQNQAVTAIAARKYLPFPMSIISKAMENGSRLSATAQKTVIAELGTASAMNSTASVFSRLSAGSIPADGAANMESLGYLQRTKTSSKDKDSVKSDNAVPARANNILSRNILGEFSYAGKTCRLLKYAPLESSVKIVLVACKEGEGRWKVVSK